MEWNVPETLVSPYSDVAFIGKLNFRTISFRIDGSVPMNFYLCVVPKKEMTFLKDEFPIDKISAGSYSYSLDYGSLTCRPHKSKLVSEARPTSSRSLEPDSIVTIKIFEDEEPEGSSIISFKTSSSEALI